MHPKFRLLITYMMVTIILLCIFGSLYFLDDEASKWICHNDSSNPKDGYDTWGSNGFV